MMFGPIWKLKRWWWYQVEPTLSDLRWAIKDRLFPPRPPTSEEKARYEEQAKKLQPLLDALKTSGYLLKSSAECEGSALQIEDLCPIMECVTFRWGVGKYLGETKASYRAREDFWHRHEFLKIPTEEKPPRPQFQWWMRIIHRIYGG